MSKNASLRWCPRRTRRAVCRERSRSEKFRGSLFLFEDVFAVELVPGELVVFARDDRPVGHRIFLVEEEIFDVLLGGFGLEVQTMPIVAFVVDLWPEFIQ